MRITKTRRGWGYLSGALLTLLIISIPAFSQETRTVTGTITDVTGQPLSNINIVVRGTRTGTTTDQAGRFSLLVKRGDAVEITGGFYLRK